MIETETHRIREYLENANRNGACYYVKGVLDTLRFDQSIQTLEDFRQYEAWEAYSDAYKARTGIRPLWSNWKDRSVEEWNNLKYFSS